jgi:two-component system, LytTR family, response regulator
MRAIIIDDERLARAELRRLLQAHPEIEIIGEAPDAQQAENLIAELNPDLIFLDIQMPGASGFDLLDRLEDLPQVIFTTAYDQYALKAFESNALDYLLKPIAATRLSSALTKLRPPRTQPMERIFIRDGERCWFLKPAEIQLLESEGNYTRLFFGTNKPLVLKSLQAWEDRLPAALFFRASRRHLINLNEIAGLSLAPNGNLVAALTGGQEIEMSKRQSQLFRQRSSV